MNSEQFLNSLINYEKIPGYDYDLDKYRAFLKKIGSPQQKITNALHIGGTKGKGSTAAIISSCLQTSGYKVGLFTSPHLCRVNERIRVNNVPITNQAMASYLKNIKPHIKEKNRARTYFEVLTTLAYMHFVRQKVDFSIMEVGLGGRIDATNLINPLLTIITRIGYDHTHLLGTRLSQIAAEKAGIIKTHGTLITSAQRPTVSKIIGRTCRQRSCDLIQAQDQHEIKMQKQTISGIAVKVKGRIGKFHTFLPLPGVHHVENLLLSLAALYELRTQGFKISTRAVQKGIRKTRLRGRFDVISKNPLIIFDSAHNTDSFQALLNNIDALRIRKFSLIFGCSMMKQIDFALQRIFPRAQRVFLVKAAHSRAMSQTELYAQAKKHQTNLIIADSVKNALAYSLDNDKLPIIITGSFYLWQEDWCTD